MEKVEGQSQFYLSCDVGTGSVRVAAVGLDGSLVGSVSRDIQIWQESDGWYSQSSTDIWQAICDSVKTLKRKLNISAENIRALGFDATCSLVVLGENDFPLDVTKTQNHTEIIPNIILWMDHRAVRQADQINSTKHEALRCVGGTISPEMEIPKILYLKQHQRHVYDNAHQYFDLVDWLVYRATGEKSRSLCTVVCKWLYDPQQGWPRDLFTELGIDDLLSEGSYKIGESVKAMGERAALGLTAQASSELELKPGTPTAVGIIDAHAGALGTIGAADSSDDRSGVQVQNRVAIIAGTSTTREKENNKKCHLAVSSTPVYCEGIWGPYHHALVPGMFLTEGGQSATGKLIDFVIDTHPAVSQLRQVCHEKQISRYEALNDCLMDVQRREGLTSIALLARDLHVLDYFHGNQSPRANPTLKGMICGVTLDDGSLERLAVLYLATVQAVLYGTRHVIDVMNQSGHAINAVCLSGGISKNSVFVQQLADIVNCNVLLSDQSDAVLVGGAVLAAVAAGDYSNLQAAMAGLTNVGKAVSPTTDPELRTFHNNKYQVYTKMYEDFMSYRSIMNSQ